MKEDLLFRHSHFGINDCECQFHLVPFEETLATWEYSFKLTSGMGMHWDRVHLPGVFSWNVIEHEKGEYDWKYPDALVNLAQKYDIHLLPNIWPFAWWDQKAWEGKGLELIEIQHMEGENYLVDKDYPFPPRYAGPHDWSAYSKWIMAMVERYDGDGVDDMPGLKYPIKYWEVENEVGSIAWGLPPFPTKPENYSKLLKESYLAAKRADPKCKILIEGWALDVNEPFFRHAIELGIEEGQQYFDIMNLHSPLHPRLTLEDTANQVLRTRDLLAEYGLEMPIWITEYASGMDFKERRFQRPLPETPKDRSDNLHSNPLKLTSDFTRRNPPVKYSARAGARKLIIGLTLAYRIGVEKIFYATLGQRITPPSVKSLNPLPNPERVFDHTILNLDGSKKLMYYSIGMFMKKLDKFKKVRKVNIDSKVKAYIYDLGPEWNPPLKQTLLLWSDEKKELTLEGLSTDEVLVTNLIPETDKEERPVIKEGKPVFKIEIKKVIKGTVNITVTEDPIIFEL